MHFILREPLICRALENADSCILATSAAQVPELFTDVPLEAFAVLLHDLPEEFPNLRKYFPLMASDDVQKRWTGTSGYALLAKSSGFVARMVAMYERNSKKSLADARVLDYGVGWGRLLRLMQKYVPETGLHGVDAWDTSLDIARGLHIRAHLAKVDAYPTALPFEGKFDLVFAFSVFTHLSQRSTTAVLSAIRSAMDSDGLLVATIRPPDYWTMTKEPTATELMVSHRTTGFAFKPHKASAINGDIPYGDTSMTVAFLENAVPGWRTVALDFALHDPLQILVGLKPV